MTTTGTKYLFAVISVPILIGTLLAVYLFYTKPSVPLFNQQPTTNNQQLTNPGLPKRLVIPTIGVDAPVINVGLTSSGAVDTPKGPSEVAWYQLGPRPGAEGSAVITGHFGTWRDGSGSVFDDLNKLKMGDKIYLKDDAGAELVFKVIESKMYQPNQSPAEVFNKTGGAFLNLITCQGDWLANQKTYNQRLVIFTELVK